MLRSGLPFLPLDRSDAAWLYFERWNFAYGRVPKAGNSFMRARLARQAGLDVRGGGTQVNQDRFWRRRRVDGARMLTGAQLRREAPDAFAFTLVRDPFHRIASCWRTKVASGEAEGLVRGIGRDATFEAFVRAVAATPDERGDVHIRSQWAVLFAGGLVEPVHVQRLDRLVETWPVLRNALLERRFDIGEPPHGRAARVRNSDGVTWTPELIALVRERYARDFDAFFTDVAVSH